ncbi:MAG: hypothetical protein OWU32_00740 [Firmicutes bacterium]|nr:hypothetical protein [Bacillota bacterium]
MSATTVRFFWIILITVLVAVVSYMAGLEGDPLFVRVGAHTYFALPYQFSVDQTETIFANHPVVVGHVGLRPLKQRGTDGSEVFLLDATGGDGKPAWRLYRPL